MIITNRQSGSLNSNYKASKKMVMYESLAHSTDKMRAIWRGSSGIVLPSSMASKRLTSVRGTCRGLGSDSTSSREMPYSHLFTEVAFALYAISCSVKTTGPSRQALVDFWSRFQIVQLGQWNVPSRAWHVDAHFTFDPNQLFGVRVFAYVSDVLARSGGTLVVRGSHRLVKRFVANLSEDERLKGVRSAL